MAPGGEFRDPVADRYLDRIGLLSSNLPERIVRFYTLGAGVPASIQRAASGEFAGKPANLSALIREDLAVWKEATVLGQEVITELRKVAMPRWQARKKGFL
jgi:hypothetical protein